MKKHITLFLVVLGTITTTLAQTKIKDGTVTGSSNLPINDAILELESNNKGLLIPRVELTSSSSPSPLSSHVEGIIVYNKVESDDVIPGLYYNNGSKWQYIISAKSSSSTVDSNITINVGETYVYFKKDVPLTSNTASNMLRKFYSDVPVLEGLRLEAVYASSSLYRPSLINTTNSPILFTYTSKSEVNNKYNRVNISLAAGAREGVDGDDAAYWSHLLTETEECDLFINDKWYKITWNAYTDRTTNPSNNTFTIRIAILRIQ
jgi:hypothetical protein